MTSAVWALIGVAVGAIIPALATVYQARKTAEQADKDRVTATERAQHDRQEARDSRLFDLRRDAYVEFQTEARHLLEWHWRAANLPYDGPDPDYDAFDPLIACEAKVLMFGTAAAAGAAREVITFLSEYARNSNGEGYTKVEESIRRFAQAGRTDLGARG